jgi:hypothetical protein
MLRWSTARWTLSIVEPNMPTLHSHSLVMFRMAHVAAHRASRPPEPTSKIEGTDDALIAIILAACTVEGFVNDLVGHIRFCANDPRSLAHAKGNFSRLVAIADTIEFMERARWPTQAKYLAIAALTGTERIKSDREPFQSLDSLLVLRNAIVHTKPIDIDDPDKTAKLVASLVKRGIARRDGLATSGSPSAETWFHQLRVPGVAQWATESAHAIMLALADSLASVGDIDDVMKSHTDYLRPDSTPG